MKVRSIAIVKIWVENLQSFELRKAEYDAKSKEIYKLREAGVRTSMQKRRLKKAQEEYNKMRLPLFERKSLTFLRWEKSPKSQRKREELELAIREGKLPHGAEISVNGFPANPHRWHNGEELKITFI